LGKVNGTLEIKGIVFMTDMLIKLYGMTDLQRVLHSLHKTGLAVHQAMASEKYRVIEWVQALFGDGWAAECDVAFSRQPIACTVGVADGRIVGFACYDSTYRNFLGPIGVDPDYRQKGLGRAILLVTLQAMANAGYAYAIVGGAGPTLFFETCAGATAIPESTPGIYRPAIKK
jgi:GNAT superfamily N-acetyltransferase